MSWRRPVAALASILLLGTACASTQAARARLSALTAEMDALRYPRPIDEVWQAVRLLLSGRGYLLAGEDARAAGKVAPPGGIMGRLVSPARETRPYEPTPGLLQQLGIASGEAPPRGLSLDTGWSDRYDRYHADALELPDGVRVVLWRFDLDPVANEPKGAVRDPEMELALARRLAPEAAARIEAGLGPPGSEASR
jgi:hypothetical protein